MQCGGGHAGAGEKVVAGEHHAAAMGRENAFFQQLLAKALAGCALQRHGRGGLGASHNHAVPEVFDLVVLRQSIAHIARLANVGR